MIPGDALLPEPYLRLRLGTVSAHKGGFALKQPWLLKHRLDHHLKLWCHFAMVSPLPAHTICQLVMVVVG
jgi:hypothetical protein